MLLGAHSLELTQSVDSPTRVLLVRVSFWIVTFGIKLAFDYFMLISPLVEPTRKLWQVDLYCWHYDRLHGTCELDMVDLLNDANNLIVPADRTEWIRRLSRRRAHTSMPCDGCACASSTLR